MPKPRFVPTVVALMIAAASLCPSGAVRAQVPVRHAEGVVHGFLVLRDTDGRALADGDLLQTSRGSLVTSRGRVPLQGWIAARRDGRVL